MKNIVTELENGKTLTVQVPDDWTDAQIGAEIDSISAQQSPQQGTPEAFAAHRQRMVENIPALERGFMGFGQGVANVGRQIGNLAGLIPDQEIQSAKTLAAPLLETTAGQVGSFAGEVAALAPAAGGMVGLAGKAAGTAIPALRGAAMARPVATGMATGATEGALEGAVVGGPGNRLPGAAAGAVAGGLTGGVLPLAARGFMNPSQDAQRLMDLGVDLTPGQMNPTGFFNKLEQSAASAVPLLSEISKSGQRQASNVLVQQTRPHGAPLVSGGNLNEMLSKVYDQYKPAYAKLNDGPVNPQIREQLKIGFARAVADPDVLAGGDQRKAVQRFLDNQVSRLTKAQLKAGDVLSVRSRIRAKISDAKRAQKWDEAEMLGNAESMLTENLNRGIPKQMADYNRLLDSQYSRFKVAEDAIYRMGDREYPTPFQWSQAVKKGVPKGAYARGAGKMRPEIEANASVFQTVSPSTGARLATLAGPVGLGAGAFMADPMATAIASGLALPLIGTQAGRRFSAGMSPWQAGLADLLLQYPSALGSVPRGAAAIGYTEQQ